MTVDDIAESIHNIGENIYNDLLKNNTHKIPKKPYISHDLIAKIAERDKQWHEIRQTMQELQQEQWEN